MKFAFALSLLLPSVFAGVIFPGDGTYFWTISTKNATFKDPENLFLTSTSTSRDGKFLLTPAGQGNGAFWSSPYPDEGKAETLSFHPGPANWQLALQIRKGHKGLMTFTQIVGLTRWGGPTADQIPKDTPTEWSVFKIGEGYGGGPLLVKDGQDVKTRQWVTYTDEDGYGDRVGLWDGVTPQPKTLQVKNITLVVTNFCGQEL